MLLHLIKNGQRILSAFDNSGCGCCSATNGKCAGSGSNMGILTLLDGDQIWIELPDEHGNSQCTLSQLRQLLWLLALSKIFWIPLSTRVIHIKEDLLIMFECISFKNSQYFFHMQNYYEYVLERIRGDKTLPFDPLVVLKSHLL